MRSIAGKTQGFSFAYLKELFVASMAQWMTSSGETPMNDVLLAQTKALRAQMHTAQKEKGKKRKKKN